MNTYIIFEQEVENKLDFHPGCDMGWCDRNALGRAFKLCQMYQPHLVLVVSLGMSLMLLFVLIKNYLNRFLSTG